MRVLLCVLALTGLAVGASAQTVDADCIDCKIVGDGGAESCWKVVNPSGPSDYFNVCFGTECAGQLVVAICAEECETNAGGSIGQLLVTGSNLTLDPTGCTPDLNNVITGVANPTGLPGDFCSTLVAYDVPDVKLGSTSINVVQCDNPGDSAVWLCADSSSGTPSQSGFSSDGYSTPAIIFTPANWILGPGIIPCGGNTFWVDGGLSTKINECDTICLLFAGECNFQPFLVFLSNNGNPVILAAGVVFFTGIGSVDDAGNTFALQFKWPPTGFFGKLTFVAVYQDCVTGRIEVSNEISITVNQRANCGYGQQDDGIVDANIWKVQNPAGSLDYFNVHQGTAPSSVSTLTSVEVASWDFCATGPSWGEVGIYLSNTGLDATGGTPLTPGISVVTGAAAAVPPSQSDWAYPATLYDTADVGGAGGTDFHTAVKWGTGDSCLWIGSDNDGTDGPCGTIPSTASYFTLDGYSTPALQSTNNNWVQKLNWN